MTISLALWPALALAAFGAVLDIRERRLPNWLCIALAFLAGAGLAIAEGAELLPWAFAHAATALLVGMALFALGAIGGGDAKFYSAAALSVPAIGFTGPIAFLGWTSLSGLALLAIMMIWRRMRRGAEPRSLSKSASIPYGVAIAAGLWLTHLT